MRLMEWLDREEQEKKTNVLFCGNLNALSESAIKEINVHLERSASSSFHHKESALEKTVNRNGHLLLNLRQMLDV